MKNDSPEYHALTDQQQLMIDKAVELAHEFGKAVRVKADGEEAYADGEEAYAHPHPGGGISWGFNAKPHGFNIARGIIKP